MELKSKVRCLPLLCLAVMLAQCLYFASVTGQTTDETYFNASGYPMVRYNRYHGFLGEHPPLMMQLGALPLLFLQPSYPIDDPVPSPDPRWVDLSKTGSKFLYEMGNDPETILFLERIPVIAVTLLLGWILFLWSRDLFGWGGGILTLVLYAFSPNFIAHGSLYTTDAGVSAFMFFFLFFLRKLFDQFSIKRAVVTGILLGLALLSKISAIALLPITLLLFGFMATAKQRRQGQKQVFLDQKPALGIFAALLFVLSAGEKFVILAIGPLALALMAFVWKNRILEASPKIRGPLFLFYLAGWVFCLVSAVKAGKHGPLFVWGGIFWTCFTFFCTLWFSLKTEFSGMRRLCVLFCVLWLIAAVTVLIGYTDFLHTLLRGDPFGYFVRTFKIAFSHSTTTDHALCVEGSFVKCDWRYFVTSLPLKTPLATLLCFLAGCLALRALPLQKRDRIFLWVPPVTFLAIASFLNQINIGIRHILFIYLFLFLIAGAIVPWMERLSNQLLRKFLQWVCMTVVTVSVFRTVTLAPHYLSYFSEWVGGAKEGAALAAGSNVSWGQDNRRLAKWAKEQNIASIRIRVPAHNPAEYAYYGVPLESVKDEELQNPPPGYYALDLGTYLQQQKDEQSWFAGKEPLYRAGKTIYVFKV